MSASSVPPRSEIAASPARHLGREETAIFDSVVVPKYLSMFGEPLVARLAPGRDARVCHVHCRTGYPDGALLERLPNAHVHGCDVSLSAVELARAKAADLARQLGGVVFDYRVVDGSSLPFPGGAFSHAFTIHPLAAPEERRLLFEELARILAPHGQALVAMPMRGSFAEIADLLRECALKYELVHLTSAVEAAVRLRPSEEAIASELEAAGFDYVEVDVRQQTIAFESGRGFFEDPITRLLLLPEFRVNLGPAVEAEGPVAPFDYVRDAIDKYWSGQRFETTVNVGVASGRRRPGRRS